MGIAEDMDALSGGLPERPRHKPERPVPEIPIEEFREAQRDPDVVEFLEEARAEGEKAKAESFVSL
jgi:hypothetical protein